jgi:hypothetical protein
MRARSVTMRRHRASAIAAWPYQAPPALPVVHASPM